MSARKLITLGPIQGVYEPTYELTAYRDGDPRKKITGVDLRSARAISTSKSLDDVAGTFNITLKDRGVRHLIREMDVIRIKLEGHARPGLVTVMIGVVDRVRPAQSADPYAAQMDTVVTGRCVAKYLMINSLFLPVWDPQANLPTALIFGLGDAAKKVGGNTPFDIFRYLVRKYVYAESTHGIKPGLSGTPNARHWLDVHTRFSRKLGYQVPFLQFDEDSVATALKRIEILGFTEAWVDELGRVVYRRPGWNSPVVYSLPTNQLIDHAYPRGDEDAATYLEVIPAGDPGIDSGAMQALRAGRAPVPSSYVNTADSIAGNVSPEFIIDTDSSGQVTAKGRRNHWYQLQRRLGLRPQQITSPLLYSQEQAQQQAEGLLQHYGRAIKTFEGTIPGAPELRLGYNIRVHGDLDAAPIDRTFYIDSIQHLYVEDDSYKTTFTGSHGRDPWDPRFTAIALPRFDPATLASSGGTLDPSASPGQTGDVKPAYGTFQSQTTRPDGKRVLPKPALVAFLAELAGACGRTVETNTYTNHSQFVSGRPGVQSDHWEGWAADLHVTANYPDQGGMQLAFHAFRLGGKSTAEANQLARGGGQYARFNWDYQGQTYLVQILWGPNVGHTDHVHVGLSPA